SLGSSGIFWAGLRFRLKKCRSFQPRYSSLIFLLLGFSFAIIFTFPEPGSLPPQSDLVAADASEAKVRCSAPPCSCCWQTSPRKTERETQYTPRFVSPFLPG